MYMKNIIFCIFVFSILLIFANASFNRNSPNYNYKIANNYLITKIINENKITSVFELWYENESILGHEYDSIVYEYYKKYVSKIRIKNKFVSNYYDSLLYYFLNNFDYNIIDKEHKNIYSYFLVTTIFIESIIRNINASYDTNLSKYMNFVSIKKKNKTTIKLILKHLLYGYYNVILDVDLKQLMKADIRCLYCLEGDSLNSNSSKWDYLGNDYEDYIPTSIKVFGLNFIANGQEKCLYTPPYKQKPYLKEVNKIFNEYQKFKLLRNFKLSNLYLDSCLYMFNKIYENKNKYKSQKKQAELQLAYNDINYSIVNYTQSSYILSCLPALVKDPKKVEWHSIIKLIYLRAMASCLLGNTEAANADFKIIQDYAPNLPIFKINSCH